MLMLLMSMLMLHLGCIGNPFRYYSMMMCHLMLVIGGIVHDVGAIGVVIVGGGGCGMLLVVIPLRLLLTSRCRRRFGAIPLLSLHIPMGVIGSNSRIVTVLLVLDANGSTGEGRRGLLTMSDMTSSTSGSTRGWIAGICLVLVLVLVVLLVLMKIIIGIGVTIVVRMRMWICGDRRQRRQMVVRRHMYVVGKRLAVLGVVVMHVLLMPGGVTAGQGTAIIGIGIVTMR